jgi:hypothetical protein
LEACVLGPEKSVGNSFVIEQGRTTDRWFEELQIVAMKVFTNDNLSLLVPQWLRLVFVIG